MTSQGVLKILGLSGSLRRASFNTGLLRAAGEVCGEQTVLTLFDVRDIPFYDEDIRARGMPEVVEALRTAIRSHDGILIATPEYNRSTSGVLKNVIDWASRPPDQPFDGARIALMSASNGGAGGLLAQYHIRQSLAVLNAVVMSGLEIAVSGARDKFDEDGHLIHDPTREFLRVQMQHFVAFMAERRRA